MTNNRDSEYVPEIIRARPLSKPHTVVYPEAIPPTPSEGGLDYREILRIVRKRKWLILAIVLLATAYTAFDSFRTKSSYQASATVEIGRENARLVRTNEVFVADSDPLLIAMRTNELIIRSAPLLEDVAARLELDRRPQFLDVTQPKKPAQDALQDIVNRFRQGSPAGEAPANAMPESTVSGANRGNPPDYWLPYVMVLERGLSVTPIRDTRALSVGYTHTDPVLAARIANTIAERFVEATFDNTVSRYTAASEWLERSTGELKARIENSERALADYMRTHNIYSIEVETLNTARLSQLHDLATRAETDRILKESLYEQVRQGRIAHIPEAFADPQTIELQRKLNDLTVHASGLSATYGPLYPELAEVTRQIQTLREQIESSRHVLEGKLLADYERAVRDETALKETLAAAKADAAQENQLSIQYSILQQDVDTARALYTEFLQKTNQAELEVAQQHNNTRVLSPARVPTGPVGPNRTRTIFMGLMLSLAGSIGLAYFLERNDHSIRSVEHVNRFTQLPALAVIPAMTTASLLSTGKKRRQERHGALGILPSTEIAVPPSVEAQRARLVEMNSRSPVAEAYRALRTAVLLSNGGNVPKTILLTSVHMSEGKTTTATNTAISLAQLGSPILLIDCDMRKPAVHRVFEIDNKTGLSTYLEGSAQFVDVLQPTSTDNLHVIPAGPIPSNPSELLSSQRMQDLLKEASGRYKHVVIDSPPLGSVTDPVILSTVVDGVILVVQGGSSSRQIVQRACRELTLVGAHIIGVVLNNVDLRHEGYGDHYYYSYYKGYYGNDGKPS